MRRLSAAAIATAERELRAADPALGRLIRDHGPCSLHRPPGSAFDVLGWSIISQQLSTRAASSIGRRVLALTGETSLSPAGLLRVSPRRLRAAGLSNNKTRFLQSLASAAQSGELNARSLAQLPDEEVQQRLVALPGIGAWTAQMFLMFALRRADVFSPADIGLQRATQQLYALAARPVGDELLGLAERWRPWRTVASWYLWRTVD